MVACVRVTITKIIDTFVDRCIVVSSPDPIYAETGLHHRCKSISHIHLFYSIVQPRIMFTAANIGSEIVSYPDRSFRSCYWITSPLRF